MKEAQQVEPCHSAEGLQPSDTVSSNQIDLLCDAFEEAWFRGESPQIEAYLERCEDALRESLLAELLYVDRELRIRHGESPSRLDYQRRFPQYSTVIDGLEFATIFDRSRSRLSAIANSVPSIAGTKLAHFELLEALGSGASGTVWRATDSRLRRTVAIKTPHRGLLTDNECEQFLREGQACAQLQHPNIVAVYEVGEDDERVFIVSEYIEGPNLRDWLKQHRPTPHEAADLAAQLGEALNHAHEQGVIHRDLKPANVLLDGEGRAHITDFGLAKWTADTAARTVDGNIVGTPAYMSPEQARGEAARVDRRSDVYGLGALLYEMLTNQPPFHGDIATIVHQVAHDEPIAPHRIKSRIPRDLETICLKAMEKTPSRRYATAQEFSEDLRRFIRGQPILARPVSRFEKSWRWCCTHPAVATVALLSIVATLAAVKVGLLTNENYELQGYRPVEIDTIPHGAKLALVPIDSRTGEPSADATDIILPQGTTPIRVHLKPGDYHIEAVHLSEGVPTGIAEVRKRIAPRGTLSTWQIQRNREFGEDVELIGMLIHIRRTSEVIAGMVAVPIDESLRQDNSLLPKVLYVDIEETIPREIQRGDSSSSDATFVTNGQNGTLSLVEAQRLVERQGKRLPSAAEYDAIALVATKLDTRLAINDIAGGMAEWTTSTYEFTGVVGSSAVESLRDMRILKGYGDPHMLAGISQMKDGEMISPPDTNSTMIGCRGVHSGEPRFVEW